MGTNSATAKYVAWPTGQCDIVRARIARHRELDEIIQGVGWDGDRGCAIGCSLDAYSHEEYARILGIPVEIARLVDVIHEYLPRELALDWPGRVAHALQPGADTTHAWSRFAIWLLREECKSSVGEMVARLYERRMQDDEPSIEEWEKAGDNEETDAWSTAWMVVPPRVAVRAAVWGAARAARDETASYLRQADKLIEILGGNI